MVPALLPMLLGQPEFLGILSPLLARKTSLNHSFLLVNGKQPSLSLSLDLFVFYDFLSEARSESLPHGKNCSINPHGAGGAGGEARFGGPRSYTTLKLPCPAEAAEGRV